MRRDGKSIVYTPFVYTSVAIWASVLVCPPHIPAKSAIVRIRKIKKKSFNGGSSISDTCS